MTILLTDKEIQYIITEGVIKHSGLGIPKQRQAIDRDIAKAQLKKVMEWLESNWNGTEYEFYNIISIKKEDWQSLLNEVATKEIVE